MISDCLRTSLLVLGLSLLSTKADVVINEIFYHAPDEVQDLQWIELYNSGPQAADLGAWKLAKGIDYQFPAGTTIAADGYLVLAQNEERFQEVYGFRPAGLFKRPLSHKGMRLDLLNKRGKKVDSVKYKDEEPWPTGADGCSGSLERICPSAGGSEPDNWISSPLRDASQPGGTPSQRNAGFSATLPPVIKGVKFSPSNPAPDQPVSVEAEVIGPNLKQVSLRYRVAGPGLQDEEQSLPMTEAAARHFTATIPGQKSGQIIRFRIQAISQKNATRFYPGQNEPRPALSCYVYGGIPTCSDTIGGDREH
jgi:hypothetical protein